MREMIKDGQKLKKILSLVSNKIRERFPTVLAAFRFFDTDHCLHITLNDFVQGIEYLRIKISFDMIKDAFNFLDVDNKSSINYTQFSQLSYENLSKYDIIDLSIASLKIKRR